MGTIIDTQSICPECLSVITARVSVSKEAVEIEKECPLHGRFRAAHIWDTKDVYERMMDLAGLPALPAEGLVLNITNDCNIHCPFCFARANERKIPHLTLTDVKRITALHPGRIVYLSGGEPTVRGDLQEMISWLKRQGFRVGLFTNGKKLAEWEYVFSLQRAGLDFVILQFDSLDDGQYRAIRGESLLSHKLRAVLNLDECGIPVYLFVMLVDERSTEEVGALIDYAVSHHDCVKVINFNPVWDMGRVGPCQPLPTSVIIRAIASGAGVTMEEFLDATEFSFYLSRFLARLFGRRVNIQPLCELRCYCFVRGGRLVPITRLMDNRRINRLLRALSCEQRPLYWCLALARLMAAGLAAFLSSKDLRYVCLETLMNLARYVRRPSLFRFSPFLSIIVGTFQTAKNLDLALVGGCNLYSDYPQSGHIFSACVRQIILEQADLSSVDRLVATYQECLRIRPLGREN